jgi:choline dehydrogenase-like flavoprotein
MANIDPKDVSAVVIIGSGAGGGTLAHELTRRGIKVVLLEAGKRQSLETFSQVPGEAFGQLTWLDARTQSGNWGVARDFPSLPAWHCKTVGGTTVHWTASAPRLQPWELRARSTYGKLTDASLIDWPISYEELEKYYAIAERRMGVTRRNDMPGLPASNNFKVMHAGAKRLGYKQVHTGHMAINSKSFDGRGFCIQQGFCVQGCKMGAKWSTLYTEIPDAEATGNLDLRIECTATKIEHAPDGSVNGVIYRDSHGQEKRQKARLVCVAGNAIETTRLLLLSESSKYPHGLANSSGQVGRNYCHQITGFVWGIFDKPVYSWRGATLAGVIEDEVTNDPRRGFVGGYRIELVTLDLPTLPLVGPAFWLGPRFCFDHGKLSQPCRHVHQRRRSAALRQSHHAELKREGCFRPAGGEHSCGRTSKRSGHAQTRAGADVAGVRGNRCETSRRWSHASGHAQPVYGPHERRSERWRHQRLGTDSRHQESFHF